jgi:hypothetical protein
MLSGSSPSVPLGIEGDGQQAGLMQSGSEVPHSKRRRDLPGLAGLTAFE